MWRAIVLALVAYTAFQVFSPSPALAELGDGKGGWTLKYSHGGINVAYADLNQDCVIDVLDEQAIAFRYGASWLLLLYDQRYDVEPQGGRYDWPPPIDPATGMEIGDDWDIDIKDLQFVFGRDGMACAQFWDPELMGEYSFKSGTPTGPGTACGMPVTNPPGSAYYVDPIGVVFFANATASRLEQEAQDHGFPELDDEPQQRFWEVGRCTLEDVDAREDREWTCGFADSCESWHFRAEVIDQGYRYVEHEVWGQYAIATPHFDEDCDPWGHFVPQVFAYPDELYPGFSGSGFEAGVYRAWKQFVLFGGHGFAGTEYWGNITPIQQGGCASNQWPRGDGNVYYIEIY